MKKLFLLTSFILSAYSVNSQEILTLTTPVTTTKSNCTITAIHIDVESSSIKVELKDNNGVRTNKVYDSSTNPTGASLLHTLNTSNFTTNSMIKQSYNRLSSDGVCIGTVSGTPQ